SYPDGLLVGDGGNTIGYHFSDTNMSLPDFWCDGQQHSGGCLYQSYHFSVYRWFYDGTGHGEMEFTQTDRFVYFDTGWSEACSDPGGFYVFGIFSVDVDEQYSDSHADGAHHDIHYQKPAGFLSR